MRGRFSNTRSSLRRRTRRGDPMAAFDRLPMELRRWLAEAALPWSPRSALRLWQRSLARHDGDASAALRHLSRVELAMLQRDTQAIWGATHPGAPAPQAS